MFNGEKGLVIAGLIGFLLAALTGSAILIRGPIVLPEGDLGNAFSFNAAIGIFILSIAAVLPLAGFSHRKRRTVRWLFIFSSLYAYAIETIQHFRGLNPRFSREGGAVDAIAGMAFGVVSLLLVTLCVLLLIQFFKVSHRPLLILGIRYAFLSVFAANLAGVGMVLLQSRFVGGAGNLIVLHGMGFHALQTLIVSVWLLEKVKGRDPLKKRLIHYGSAAWMAAILLIGVQTVLGRSVFELSLLPILAGLLIIVWLATVCAAFVLFLNAGKDPRADATKVMEKPVT
ncbi:hypothetical protein QNH23_14380 [Siminovitchia fortis]|uniref:Uncharacterized protein n=1 Tax=Siminovitchia fortis TaxID=254758 RepID=A0A443IM54_9BACI|nr:hypothetical protein [Siminovitchia fortis]RWR06243.1 hypothetical protein D4N35_014430 [Siminovitchia fortis]WHY81075.1 hypothetical protein QNH23_14380 [Siminovitchia fortis]